VTQKSIPAIVITGGPCGGKTSALAWLKDKLLDYGIYPVFSQELARVYIGAGLHPALVGSVPFQTTLVRATISQEEHLLKLAANLTQDTVVLICDRGRMDTKGYLTPHEFNRMLSHNGWNEPMLRDRFYQAVLHMVTAADGAEQFYVADSERYESLDEARLIDQKTQVAWCGHPHFRLIDNSTDFEGKKHRLLKEILHVLGVPIPLEIERKFKIKRPDWHHLSGATKFEIEQVYLTRTDADVEERVRRRSQEGQAIYFRTLKRARGSGIREEREWQISESEYHTAFEQRDRNLRVIRKDRWCFVHNYQYFELDDFTPMGEDSCVLEIELTDRNDVVSLPNWLRSVEEVTDNPAYSNYERART